MAGRFDSAPDPAAFDFGVSFPFDRRLFEDDVTGSLAWAEALARAGVLDATDAKAIADGLTAILEQGRANPSWIAGDDEDVHSFVERQLVARVGDAGRRLHTGRSRNEQVSVDLRLYLRRRIPLLQQKLRATIAAFADQAEKAGDALMPSYTHMRRAMPVLVSHFLLSHAAALRRDHARLEAAREEANALTLGSGAIAGTGLRDRHRVPRRETGLCARRAEQHGRLVRSRLRGDVSVRGGAVDGAPVAHCGRLHPDDRRGVRLLRARGFVRDGEQHDAAEEEPRSARARARQGGTRDRTPDGIPRHDEGPAHRLQQGSAGRQRAAVRRRRHARGLARRHRRR